MKHTIHRIILSYIRKIPQNKRALSFSKKKYKNKINCPLKNRKSIYPGNVSKPKHIQVSLSGIHGISSATPQKRIRHSWPHCVQTFVLKVTHWDRLAIEVGMDWNQTKSRIKTNRRFQQKTRWTTTEKRLPQCRSSGY